MVNPKPSMDTNQIKNYLAQYDKGKIVFSHYCRACHGAPDAHITDNPTFDNLFDRLPSPAEEYFARFINNEKELKRTGDKYVQAVEKEYDNVSIDHHFKDSLTDTDMYNLIVYIKIASKKV